MRRIAIIGGGGHARVMISILNKLPDFEVAGYLAPEDAGTILNADYLGNDDMWPELQTSTGIAAAALGIGQFRNVTRLREITEIYKNSGCDFPVIISPDAVVGEDVVIGHGSVIMAGAIVNAGTVIGDFCTINTHTAIEHDCRIGSFTHVAPGTVLCGGITVGAEAFIGAGSTIIPNCEIAKGAVIAAGAVVTGHCRTSGQYAGIPARLREPRKAIQ